MSHCSFHQNSHGRRHRRRRQYCPRRLISCRLAEEESHRRPGRSILAADLEGPLNFVLKGLIAIVLVCHQASPPNHCVGRGMHRILILPASPHL